MVGRAALCGFGDVPSTVVRIGVVGRWPEPGTQWVTGYLKHPPPDRNRSLRPIPGPESAFSKIPR